MVVSGEIIRHDAVIIMSLRFTMMRMSDRMRVVFTAIVRMVRSKVNMQAAAAQDGHEMDTNHRHTATGRQKITMAILHTHSQYATAVLNAQANTRRIVFDPDDGYHPAWRLDQREG